MRGSCKPSVSLETIRGMSYYLSIFLSQPIDPWTIHMFRIQPRILHQAQTSKTRFLSGTMCLGFHLRCDGQGLLRESCHLGTWSGRKGVSRPALFSQTDLCLLRSPWANDSDSISSPPAWQRNVSPRWDWSWWWLGDHGRFLFQVFRQTLYYHRIVMQSRSAIKVYLASSLDQ